MGQEVFPVMIIIYIHLAFYELSVQPKPYSLGGKFFCRPFLEEQKVKSTCKFY